MSEPSAMTGLPDPQLRDPRRRNAGDAALDREAVLLEDAGQVLRRLDLLEAELAEAEDLVDHLLRELLHALDVGGGLALQARRAGGWVAPWRREQAFAPEPASGPTRARRRTRTRRAQ